jgi:hypothetical protein
MEVYPYGGRLVSDHRVDLVFRGGLGGQSERLDRESRMGGSGGADVGSIRAFRTSESAARSIGTKYGVKQASRHGPKAY